jgi:hypothetical protein
LKRTTGRVRTACMYPSLLSLSLCSCSAAQTCKSAPTSLAGAPAHHLRHRSEILSCGFRAKKNLPNIVGKSDMFGRTTPTGVETVQYLGARDGKAFFKRRTMNGETGRYHNEFHAAHHPQYVHDDAQRVCERLWHGRIRPWGLFWYIDNSRDAYRDFGTSACANGDG